MGNASENFSSNGERVASSSIRQAKVRASANVQANFTLRRVRRQKFAICVTGGIKGSVERGRVVAHEGWFTKILSDFGDYIKTCVCAAKDLKLLHVLFNIENLQLHS